MAALNAQAVNVNRISTNGRSLSQPQSGIPSAFLAINPVNNSVPSTHDSSNSSLHSNFQFPNQNGSTPFPNPPNVDPTSSQPISAPRNTTSSQTTIPLKQRRRNFLVGLANVMTSRGSPLPPALTGIPYPPNYDPANSPFKMLDVSPTEPGFFRLAGKDVDIFKLWGAVFQVGGAVRVISPSP